MKYFTVKEAVQTLPLVRKIVNDILKTGQEMKTLALANNGNVSNNEVFIEYKNILQSYLKELEDLGCDFKDWNFSIGLVDFPAKIEGEEVLLCWKSDEEEILYYHSFEAGFAGRKEIPESYFEE